MQKQALIRTGTSVRGSDFMENTVFRPKNYGYGARNRKRRKRTDETNSLRMAIARQVLIALLILMLLVAVKNINTAVTNFVAGKTKWALSHETNLKWLYKGFEGILGRQDNGLNDDTVPSGTDTGGDEVNDGEDYDAAGHSASADSGKNEATVEAINKKYKFIAPLEGYLSSGFGDRISCFTGKKEFHSGIDIDAEKGNDISVVLDGEVVESGVNRSYGNYIKINHSDELYTLYAHCSELLVTKGKKVKQGDIIAKVGNTGLSIGAHLHFEVLSGKTPLNPLDFIDVPDY